MKLRSNFVQTFLSASLLTQFFLPLAWTQQSEGKQNAATKAAANSQRLRELDFTPFASAMAGLTTERNQKLEKLIADGNVLSIQQAMKSGATTSIELTLFFLKRINQFDSTLRSYIELNPKCLEEAVRADELRASNKVLGPLHGIPVNLKDNIGTSAPLHTTGGAEILLNHSPAYDAPLVTKLRNGGAVILGKASLSEFAGAVTTNPTGANAISGKGVNPYDPALPVLGSSSGSAISCSASLTFLSVGSETSGSLIAPAAINGVVAMKPSINLVNGDGIIPLIRFQDSAGPVARNVTDAAVLLSVIDAVDEDYAAALRPDSLNGVSVAVLIDRSASANLPWLERIDQGLDKCHALKKDAKMKQALDLLPVLFLGVANDTMGYLKSHGTSIRTIDELIKYNETDANRRIPYGQNMLSFASNALTSHLAQNKINPASCARHYESLALEALESAARELAKTFNDSDANVLVSLANLHSMIYATAGYPAITVPLGLNQKGEPNGVTFIGRRGDDAKLLRFAYAFEQATKYRKAPVIAGP